MRLWGVICTLKLLGLGAVNKRACVREPLSPLGAGLRVLRLCGTLGDRRVPTALHRRTAPTVCSHQHDQLMSQCRIDQSHLRPALGNRI